MPTAGRAKFIPGALACFFAQTHGDKELVVLDDGEESIESLLPADPRVRYFRLPFEEKQTTGIKRNLCCEQAQGEVICHLDDDDWSAPERIATQLESLRQHPDARVTGFSSLLYWDTEQSRGYRYRHENFACGTSQMYYRSWWERNPFCARQLGEDADFSWRAKRAGALHCEDGGQLMVVRIHPGRTSTTEINGSQFSNVPREGFPPAFFAAE